MLVQAFPPPIEPALQIVLGLSEAAALHCPASKEGKVLVSGLGEENCSARIAIEDALYWFKKNHLKSEHGRPLVDRMGLPYIDMETMTNQAGEPVDILLRVPPTYDAIFLAPGMVLALIAILWRRPPLKGWSAAAGLELSGNLTSYPMLDYQYVREAKSQGIHTMLLTENNAACIMKDMAKAHLTPEGEGVTIRGFKDMMGMVDYVINEGWSKEDKGEGDA